MSQADRLPPHSLDAETGVLGAILIDPEVIDDVISVIRPGDFFRATHGTIFAELAAMRTGGIPIDSITLEHRLQLSGGLDKIGGVQTILDLRDGVPHALNARRWAQIVRDAAIMRDVIGAMNKGLEDAYSKSFTADDLIGTVEADIFAIRDARDLAEHATLPEALTTAMEQVRTRKNGEIVGVETGLADVDLILGDLLPGQLCAVGARPGMGKTSYGLQVAIHCVTRNGWPVLFVSLEMDRGEIGERFLSIRSGIGGDFLRTTGEMDSETVATLAKLDHEATNIGDLAQFWIDDSPSLTVAEIAAKARRLKARHGLGLVVIDYLQLVSAEPGRPRDSRQEEIARISRGLKSMAKYLEAPVLAMVQLNRESEKREDKRPRMSDLRESGQIEQDAHKVVLLHRPEYYDPNNKPGMAEIIIAKHRNGSTGSTWVNFRAPLTRFESIARHHEDHDR